ncbi:MAG: hypothetical protein WB779_04190 [Ignavibacteriaceae bacterium]
MRKISEKDIELISAYIDGELSENEIELVKKKISELSELRDKFEELKRIKKLTSDSFGTLPEAQYFETRVMQSIHSGNSTKHKLKKWTPAIGFTILAIGLMLVLKFNPGVLDRLLETQKTKIAGFYQQNLRPLLYTANLTNEDIFNFAFYKQLPLDKSSNQFIQLGTDSSGQEFFEIKKSSDVPSTNNLDRFISALKLNQTQKEQVDSIIGAYAGYLQSQILVNNKNTVAINRDLWNYNKALVADLYAYASKAKGKELGRIIPASYRVVDPSTIERVVREVKASNNDDYIFFTADTIFSEKYALDKVKLKKEMDELKKNFDSLKKGKENYNYNFNFSSDSNINKNKYSFKFDSTWKKKFSVIVDSNICRVHIPRIIVSPPNMPNFDSIFSNMHLEKVTEMMKDFTFEMPKNFPQKGGEFKMQYKVGDSLNTFKFKMDAINVDSLVKSSLKVLDSLHIYVPKNFNINLDSLTNNKFHFNFNDSVMNWNNKKYKKQMKEYQKELKKLREELKKEEKDQLPDTAKS